MFHRAYVLFSTSNFYDNMGETEMVPPMVLYLS